MCVSVNVCVCVCSWLNEHRPYKATGVLAWGCQREGCTLVLELENSGLIHSFIT